MEQRERQGVAIGASPFGPRPSSNDCSMDFVSEGPDGALGYVKLLI